MPLRSCPAAAHPEAGRRTKSLWSFVKGPAKRALILRFSKDERVDRNPEDAYTGSKTVTRSGSVRSGPIRSSIRCRVSDLLHASQSASERQLEMIT
jgi:hypothetical protein